jgi:uncharacterized protein
MNSHFDLNRMPNRPFVPLGPLRDAGVQTVLTRVRWNGLESVMPWGYPILVDAGPDETGEDDSFVKLLAYYTRRKTLIPSRGAVILLHGWEGCSHSNYNLATTRTLVRAGYDVIRLNFRDHGPGVHMHPQGLNPGVFRGTLLSEVVTAISRCAEMVHPQPVYIVGFSIGGNFALRAAIRHAQKPIPNLRRVVAVNPAINPMWSTLKIDRNPLTRRYFRNPWLAQLRQKQRLFPQRYDFEPIAELSSLVDMTTWLVRYLRAYGDAEEYFAQYAVLGNATRNLQVPTLIITAMDDMLVPVADFYGLAPSPNLKIEIHPHGGHVGYVDGYPPRHMVATIVQRALESD